MRWFKKRKRTDNYIRNPDTDKPNQRVFSYYTATKNQLNNFDRQNQALRSENAHKQKMSNLLKNWFAVFTIIVLLAISGFLLSLNREASVDINGPLYRPSGDYQKIVNEVLRSDIKNYLKPTLNKTEIQKQISAKIPEAAEISIKTSILGHRPSITISTDKALAVFVNPNGESFVLSERGRLLLPADQSNVDKTLLPVIENQSGVSGKPGEQFMSPSEASSFSKLLAQNSANNGLVKFILPANPREIYLAANDSRGYQVRYLLNDEIALQHGAYLAAIKKMNEIGQIPTMYIDVRLIEKVYFK